MLIRLSGFALLLLLAMSGAASAAEKNNGVQVEVLVFAQASADAGNYWQDSRSLPVCHAVALHDGSGAESAFIDSKQCTRKTGFEAAYGGFSGTGSNALPEQAGKLKSSNLNLLLNRNWHQASLNLAPVLLRGGRTLGDRQEFEGTLTLATTTAGTEATLEMVLTRLDGGSSQEKPQFVTLQETRVIKAGETNYFDHPLFGVLLKVSNAP